MKRLLFILFIVSISKFIYANNIIVSDTIENYSFIDKLYLYEDKTNSMTINDIINNKVILQKVHPNNVNYGFTYSKYWLKYTVFNPTNKQENLIYSIQYPFIKDIVFYKVNNGSIVDSIRSGMSYVNKKDYIKHRNYIFPIEVKSKEYTDIYISIYNEGNTIDIPMIMQPYKKFIEEDNIDILFYGLYFGAILFIILFNLFYNFALNEKISIYYTLYILFATIYVFNLSGIGKVVFFGNTSSMFFYVSAASLFLINFCLLTFSSHFLAIKSFSKKTFTTIKIFKYFQLSLCIYSIAIYYSGLQEYFTISLLATISPPISFLILFYASILAIKNKITHANFFITAYLVGFSGIIIFVFKQISILPESFVTHYALHVSFFLESLIFFFAFLLRIRSQRNKQQKQLIEKNKKIEHQKSKLITINKELEKLSIVARETNNSIIVFNNMGNALWVNQSFEELHPNIKSVKNMPISKIYNNTNLHEIIENCIKNKKSHRFNSQKKINGQYIYIQTNLTPTFDEYDTIQNFIAIDSNITQLIETQEELNIAKNKAEQANKLKTAIMTNVSHELRTPLNAIIGFTDIILFKNVKEDKLEQFIKLINANGLKLLDQIEGLLDIVRIETGDVSTEKSDFEINQIIKELHQHFDLVRKNESKNNIEIITDIAKDDSFKIHSDKRILKQIFSHLLNNAIKFTNKGHIKFGYTLSSTQTTIHFFIEDTGIGINENDIAVALESFRQVDDSVTREFGGTGIGLSIANGLTKLLGGSLEINGEKGVGTRITFKVPVY